VAPNLSKKKDFLVWVNGTAVKDALRKLRKSEMPSRKRLSRASLKTIKIRGKLICDNRNLNLKKNSFEMMRVELQPSLKKRTKWQRHKRY